MEAKTIFPLGKSKNHVQSGSYIFHRYASPLEYSKTIFKSENEAIKEEKKLEKTLDVLLEEDRKTVPNGRKNRKPSGVSLTPQAFQYAHQKLQKNGCTCFTSSAPDSPYTGLSFYNNRYIPISLTDGSTLVAAHIHLYSPQPCDVCIVEKIAKCENSEAKWTPCNMYANGEEIDIPFYEDDHVHYLLIILEYLVDNKDLNPNLRFEAAVYQYLIAANGFYFKDNDSIFSGDSRFQFILKSSLTLASKFKPSDPSVLNDIKQENERLLKSS